jgi:hypothetical protein
MPADIIIRKQKFKIKTSSEKQAFDIRRIINDQLHYKLLQVYEDTFSRPDTDLYAEKVVINLGKLTWPELHTLPQRIKEELLKHRQPGGQLYECATTPFAGEVGRTVSADNPYIGESKNLQSGNRRIEKQTDDLTAIIYFLEKGIYPWWFTAGQKKPTVLLKALSSSQIERLLLKITGMIKSPAGQKAETIKTRLKQQLTTEEVFEKFVNSYAGLHSDNSVKKNVALLYTGETISQLTGFFSMPEPKYRQELAGYLLDIMAESRVPDLKEFLLILKEKTWAGYHNAQATGVRKSKDSSNHVINDIIQQLSPDLRSMINSITGEKQDLPNAGNNKTDLPDKDKQSAAPVNNNKRQIPSLIFQEADGIYIGNAGIIILHPFLPALFKELGLLDDKDQFYAEEYCQRAVVLLHYLQTGKAEYEEQYLAFNKIICSMKPEDNLPDDIILTENEKKECDQLLDIIVGYWEALKGASREALQETFFTRNGKLSLKNEIYLLQVERSATDILIDRLPWGIGIIKLPWLSHLIHAEW